MIEFVETNGASVLIVIFMLVVLGVGLRGRESSCGMAMHQQMQQRPTNQSHRSDLDEAAHDEVSDESHTAMRHRQCH
jgi:hypothetical protein